MSPKRQYKASEYHLSKTELKRLVNAPLEFRDRCVVKTFAQTAVRRFELQNLDVRDVDFDRRVIYIREGKGDKERTIPCSDDLLGDLRHLVGRRRTGPVFLSNRNKAFSTVAINNIVSKAGRLAGLKNPNPQYRNINPHLLRHTFSRLWKDAGRSIESLSKILGHTSVKTTLDEYGTEDLQTVQGNYDNFAAEVF